MDQSLESLIKANKKTNQKKKPFKSTGSQPPRKTFQKPAAAAFPPKKRPIVVRRRSPSPSPSPPRGKGRQQSSVFDRLGTGTKEAAAVSGTRVEIRGLTKAVSITDVTQLCESVGEVKDVSKGVDKAVVVFARRSDAMTAIKKFNGLTLDGVPMKVNLAGVGGKANPFDPNAEGSDDEGDDFGGRRGNGKSKNVREGFFGTADGHSSGSIDFGYNKSKGSRSEGISVTIRNDGGRGDRGDRDRGRGGRGGRGGGGKGKGGRGGGKGARRESRQREPSKSAEDLDREMDEFMSSR